jgi:hypothetical protein
MALSVNREVDHYIDQELRSFQVLATAHVFKGAFVGITAGGYARALAGGDAFVGLAYEEMDNATGADGDASVRVYTLGDFAHPLAGATIADLGAAVYASSDDTLTLTSTSNSYVGFIVDVPSVGNILLRIDPFRSAP